MAGPQLHLRSPSPCPIPRPAAANRHFPLSPAAAMSPGPSAVAEDDDDDRIPRPPPPDTPIKGAKKIKVEAGNLVVDERHEEEASFHVLSTGPAVMFQGKPKPLEHQSFVPETRGTLEGVTANKLRSSNNCRYECSLGLLTRRFVNLLHQSEDGFLDLNRAADVLKVQKRRIYDITNVLEGVGLIEKSLKNRISWKGLDMLRPKELYDQTTVLKAKVETLYNEECRLDDMIRDMQENLCRLTEEENTRKWLYLTKEDIKSIPDFQDDTVIAINAPHGTWIEVPDPCKEGADLPPKHYQMILRSSLGPIGCYLISNNEERHDASNHSHQNATSSRTSGEGRKDQAMHQSSSYSATLEECVNGIVQIIPSDADMGSDYWLQSDVSYRETDIWGT